MKKPKVFYGYRIVLVAFLCLFMWGGIGYVFSLFVKPLEEGLDWGRGETMLAFTIYFVVQAVASPFIGRVVDRYEARRIIVTGAIVGGLGFILLTQMHHLWQFYLGYAVIGIGVTAMGPVPTSAIVSNWFKKSRGRAIGIITAGLGVGGFALAPLIGGYLIPDYGWRTSYLALAIIIWVLIIPLALLLVRTRPADKGLYPDGSDAPELKAVAVANVPPAATKGLTTKMILVTSAFWLIAISSLARQLSTVGILQNQAPHLEDIGFPTGTAATAISGIALASVIGYFIFGWLCDRISPKYACAIGLGLLLASIIIFMNVEPSSSVALLWLYVVIFGLGIGSIEPTLSMLTSTTFGLASYGAIFGMASLFRNTGAGTGPSLAGYMHDAMHTYDTAFIIFLALYAISIPAVLLVRRPKSL